MRPEKLPIILNYRYLFCFIMKHGGLVAMGNDEKRPFFTAGDGLILVGAALLLLGLYLWDWRAALAAVGLLLLIAGAVRLGLIF